MLIKHPKIIHALLLFLCVGAFAWNAKGSVDCTGLFLLNLNERKVHGYGCFISDSIQYENWGFEAGYGRLSFDTKWKYNGKKDISTWTLYTQNELNLGYASVQKDYRYISFRLDVVGLPFFKASSYWNAPDSILFAGVYYGRGNLELFDIKWKSAARVEIIPSIEGSFTNSVYVSRFWGGSQWGNHRFETGFTYGNTEPVTDRLGHVFSDSSRFWYVDPHYFYKGYVGEFSASYLYFYSDHNLFGLLREKDSEKRFFFLPLGLDLNLIQLDFKHFNYKSKRKNAYWKSRFVYGFFNLNVPWEGRRFYETMASNRVLPSSVIKTLSINVFNTSCRMYGGGETHFVDAGFEYHWGHKLTGWRVEPSLSLDIFYGSAGVDFFKRTETRKVLFVKRKTDTLSWNLDLLGSMLRTEFKIASPSERFFASVGASQIIPFYYKLEKRPKKNIVWRPYEDDMIFPVALKTNAVDADVPNEDIVYVPIIETTPNTSKNNVSHLNDFFKLFQNGLKLQFKIGFLF